MVYNNRSNQMIQYRQLAPAQRYGKTRAQHQNAVTTNSQMRNGNRSSSSGRKEVYYEDMMTRSSDNYEYVKHI